MSEQQRKPFPLAMRVGECTEGSAFVYIPVLMGEPLNVRHIVGHVRGPFSAHAATLPSSYPLQLVQSGDETLMAGYISDPCPWSPDQPMLYDAEIKATLPDGEIRLHRGKLAIRRFAPRGKSLYLNGKRWVMRGIYDHLSGPTADVSTWKTFASVRVSVWRHDRVLFSEASEQGLMIVAEPISVPPDLAYAIRGMTHQPSIAMTLLRSNDSPPADVVRRAPNLLIAQKTTNSDELQSWAHVAWMQVDDLAEFAKQSASIQIPIIAERRYHGTSLAEARGAIDTLQADLAPIGQFAGYVV